MLKLASSLTNLEIDILTEEEESERRQIEFKEKSAILIDLFRCRRCYCSIISNRRLCYNRVNSFRNS